MNDKNYIRKSGISNAEFKGQLLELIIGAIALIIGAVLFFSMGMGVPTMIVLLLGAYLALGGIAGVVPYGLSMLAEKGKYIAFDKTGVTIHSPNSKKCISLPMANIASLKKTKGGISFDIFANIYGKKSNAGSVMIEYTNENGKKQVQIFGPIDNVDDFVLEFNQTRK